MKISKKRFAGLLATMLVLFTIAGVWAYYTGTHEIDNQLSTKGYGSTLTEEFTVPQDGFKPGQEVKKLAAVKNTGDAPLVVRAKMRETWTRGDNLLIEHTAIADLTIPKQNDSADGLVAGDQTVVEKLGIHKNWVAGTDGYWYYNGVLAAGATTEKLLSAIKLSADTDMGKRITKNYYHEGLTPPSFEPGEAGDTGWQEFTGPVPAPNNSANNIYTRAVSSVDPAASGYANAVYDLIITAETCQANAAAVTAANWEVPSDVSTAWALK